MRKILMIVILWAFTPGAMCKDNPVITMDELRSDLSKYESKLVDVTGEVILKNQGTDLCGENEYHCLFICLPEYVNPKPSFKLRKDRLYEEFDDLSGKIGLVQRSLGKAKLMATLRGQVYYYIPAETVEEEDVFFEHPPDRSWIQPRFVLQRVLKLDVQKLTPENTPSDE